MHFAAGVFTAITRIRHGFFLLLVASSILGGLAELGITDRFTVVLLTTALGATAVRRVLDPAPARRCSPVEAAFAALSGIAWLAIEFAARVDSQAVAQYSFYVPTSLRAAAAAALFAEILRPLIRAHRLRSVVGDRAMDISVHQVVMISAVCVASANLVFVALAAAWMCGVVALRVPGRIGARGGYAPGVLVPTRFFAGS